MEGKQLCNHQTIKGLQNGLQKGIFYGAKGHLLHFKRASFTMQKGIFYNAKGRLLHSKRAPLDLRVIKILTTHTTKGDY